MVKYFDLSPRGRTILGLPHDYPHDGTPSYGLRCCYAHLKDRMRAGQSLSDDERAFVGAYAPRPPERGWRQPSGMVHEPDVPEPSPKDVATLQGLMNVAGVCSAPPGRAVRVPVAACSEPVLALGIALEA